MTATPQPALFAADTEPALLPVPDDWQADHRDRLQARRAAMLERLDHPDTYTDRWEWACLQAGEQCPACGHIFVHGGYDAGRMHSPYLLDCVR